MNANFLKNIRLSSKGYLFAMSLLFIFLGYAITSIAIHRAKIESIKQQPSRKLHNMVVLVKEAEKKKISLEKEVVTLRKQLEELQTSSSNDLTKTQIDKIYRIAGLTQVTGKGILVTIQDPSNPNVVNPNLYPSITSDDILKIVNELKSGGATAISINNQRLVTTTEIVNSGKSIMVNQTRLNPPYLIKAIGDPETLKMALSFRGSIVEYLRFYNIDIKIDIKDQSMSIPAYTGKI